MQQNGSYAYDDSEASDADAPSSKLLWRSVSADGLPVLVLDCNPHFESATTGDDEAHPAAPEGARERMALAVEGFIDELRSIET